jgi:hypothetical protein
MISSACTTMSVRSIAAERARAPVTKDRTLSLKHGQNHFSSRSSAVQKPAPSFLCPCQISGMNDAFGAGAVEHVGDHREVDRALADLQPLAVDALGVDDVQVRRVAADLLEEFLERARLVRARELRMRDVEADAVAGAACRTATILVGAQNRL